jgi:hypothetical protein
MRKLEVLNTNYEKSGLYAKIPALNDMTLKEFFEGLNIVKNYDSVRTFNNAIETVDESILIDSSISLISGHEYFSAFDLIFKTMPVDAPDSYRLWVGSEGVTDTITHSFLTNEKEVFMNVKTSGSTRTSDLYLNLFGMTIGQSMSLETNLYFIIDLSNLSFEVTEEQVYYYYRMYRYLKDSKSFDGYTYLPKGQSKYDVAYVNKTIDEPIAELNGHTLREVFEDGNKTSLNQFNYPESGVVTQETDYNLVEDDAEGEFYSIRHNAYQLENKHYYSRISVSSSENISVLYQLRFSNLITPFTFTNLINDEIVTKSSINTGEAFNGYLRLLSNNVGSSFKVHNVTLIVLDDLGISPSTDMDYYYSLYQARKNIKKKVLTYADVFGEITENKITNGNWTVEIAQDFINMYFYVIGNKIDGVAEWGVSRLYGSNISPIVIDLGINSEVRENRSSYDDYIDFRPIYSNPNSFEVDVDFGYISFTNFDELITKEQLDTMLAHYLLVKNIVIYPEIYVPAEPVGLGNRFKLLAVDDTVYGHELDFEDISFKMYFGVNFDAYKGYHAMMNMLRSNKAIIEYDWGIGPRYNDVRLLNAPKTEKDTSLLIISKFYFKRLNPFYELIEVSDEDDMKNESDLDSPVKLDLTVSDTTVSIKLLDASSGVQQEISFDFTGVSTPFNLTIDPETKKLLIDDITDAYDYADHTKDSFIYLPGDSEIYSINITGAAVNKITYKKWVIS